MTGIKIDYNRLAGSNKAWKQHQKVKRGDPLAHYIGRHRRFETAEQMAEQIEKYFESCWGVAYTNKGVIVRDENGKPLRVQKEPYTLSGLARFLGLNLTSLSRYEFQAQVGVYPPEFAAVVRDAKLRIQEYAEKRLYDRDGASGARFVLEAGFGWMTKRESKEIDNNKKRIKLAQKELKMKQKLLGIGKDPEDTQITINVVRAGEKNDKD